MEWRDVDSSSIRRIGYAAQTQELQIEFMSGGLYSYANVPKPIADGFLNAERKGAYFFEKIRAIFEYRCLRPAPKKERKPDAADGAKSEKVSTQKRKRQPI
jgi:hypothetical protein